MKNLEKWWEEDFDEDFCIGKGRKWILTQEEASEIKSFISRLLEEQKERILAALPKEADSAWDQADGWNACLLEVRKVIEEV